MCMKLAARGKANFLNIDLQTGTFFRTGFDLELLDKFIFGPPFCLGCDHISHEVLTTKTETESE